MGRAPCCDKASVKKGPWSAEEDAKLKAYIENYGTGGNWIALPQKIGLQRCGKSCRLRWLNYLRPNIKHGGFSEEEDSVICSLYISIGSRWSIIAAQLPGRTDNDIKNYWNTRLKKKLLGGRRKQSNINGLPSPATTREWDPKDAKGMEDDSGAPVLSNSALERLQLHMELQALQNPFYLYSNPALCPKLHPLQLQEKMVQIQSLQLLNQIRSPNLMQNLHLPPSPGPNPDQPGQGQMVELENSGEDISIAFENGSNPIELQSQSETNAGNGIHPISSLPTFQRKLDNDLMILNNKYESMGTPREDSLSVSEFDCFSEMDGSKDGLIWWSSNELDGGSAFLNSWDSTSFLGSEDCAMGYIQQGPEN